MALVESLPLSLGSHLPSFSLPTADGVIQESRTLMGTKGLLVVFTCNHCPYALAIWDRLIAVSHVAKEYGISTVAINPNIHPNYPDDAPEKMLEKIRDWKIPFPYLVDEFQDVARAYKAQCTPDLYLLGVDYQLIYHGRLDDNWKVPEAVQCEELKDAIVAFGSGLSVESKQFPSMGCSIKWKN